MAKMHKLFTDYRLDLCCIFFCLHFIFPMPDFKSLGPTDFWFGGSAWPGEFTAASLMIPLGNLLALNYWLYLTKQRKNSIFCNSLQGGQSPMERAVSAFNFVIENKGIEHFKPPRELLDTPLFAVYGYDVVLFLLFILVTFLVLSWQCLKFSVKLCCGSKKTKLEWKNEL